MLKTDLFILRPGTQICHYSLSCLLGALEITNRSGSPKYISQNQGVDIYCAFKGRSRPQITWYKDDEPIINESESLRHEELERSGEDGTLTTLTILHVPGREEFDGFYKCAANSRFNNSWWTSKNSTIQVRFLCKWSHIYFIYLHYGSFNL